MTDQTKPSVTAELREWATRQRDIAREYSAGSAYDAAFDRADKLDELADRLDREYILRPTLEQIQEAFNGHYGLAVRAKDGKKLLAVLDEIQFSDALRSLGILPHEGGDDA